MYRRIVFVLLLVGNMVFAQDRPGGGKDKNPVLHEVSNKDVVQSIYPDAVKVEKVNDYWYRILNAKSKTIGFAMSSV